jgi:tripartite-type tricarboxylate transporter receptor subunit TctC
MVMSCAANADDYPSKPIRVIVPYAAGGAGDLIGRAIGTKMTDTWGQQILIDNRPGASGNIGTELAAHAPADGYTLLLATDIQMAINPHLFQKLPFDPDKDFAPVIAAYYVAFVLAANPSVPAKTLPELVDYLKAHPGKLNYGSAGLGSTHHLTMEWLKSVAGIDVIHVPYKGSGQILPDLISGQIQLAYMGLSPAMPYIKSGRLRALAVGTASRLNSEPQLPTLAETYPGIEASATWSYFAPAGTPRAIIVKLNEEINRIEKLKEVRDLLVAQGLIPLGGTPEDLAARTRSDSARWARVIRQIGLQPE